MYHSKPVSFTTILSFFLVTLASLLIILLQTEYCPAAPGKTILRIHGSNTIGAKLGPDLVKRYLKYTGYNSITQEPGEKENEYFIVAKKGEDISNVEIKAHGSSTSFKSLAADLCDVGMASRKIKDKELRKLDFLGDLSTVNNEHVLAIDGIAVIVHKSNTLESIDVETLLKIFSGQITRWDTIGGAKGIIKVYSRDDNSGTYDTFKHMVLKKKPLVSNAKRYESNAALSDDVSHDPQGIGFVGMPYVREAKPLKIEESSGSIGYLPTTFTAAYEEYPLSRRLYLYTAESPKNPLAKEFAHFTLSYEGQKSVALLGFAKLSMDMEERNITDERFVSPSHKERYTAETLGGRRVNFNFRFSPSKDDLENRSLKDLERFIHYIKQKDQYYYEPLLIGINACQQAEQMRSTLIDSIGLDNFHVPPQTLCLDNALNTGGRPLESLVEVWLRVVDDGA